MNIGYVCNNYLCTGCGMCAGICPKNAISMNICGGLYLPIIDPKCCQNCGLCLRSCPGYAVNFEKLNNNFFGAQPKNGLVGNYLKSYVGHSADDSIRCSSSSGGVVTQLLVYALEKRLIDGALVVRMNKEKPLEPEVFIARTKQQLISASKSKYCPVSIQAGIAEILKTDGRYAIVGLPCHIHALRKAQLVNKVLNQRVVFAIGLICAKTSSFEATRFLLKSLGVSEEAVSSIEYRGNGWPGGFTITFKQGATKFIPFNDYRHIVSLMPFAPPRCLLCPDALNELSDISVGDAWLPKYANDRKGQSIIISRSQRGETLLEQLSIDLSIIISPIGIGEVMRSQKGALKFKKTKKRQAREVVYSLLRCPVPNFVTTDPTIPRRYRKMVSQISEAFVRCTLVYVTSKNRGKLPSLAIYSISTLIKLGSKMARKKLYS